MTESKHPPAHDPDRCFLTELEEFAILRIRGGEALDWLQGQLSADISKVAPDRSLLAAWCSPKGRVLALFRLLLDPQNDGYAMICDRWFIDRLLPRFRMFILRADVHIEQDDRLAVFGISGSSESIDKSMSGALGTTTEAIDRPIAKWLLEAKNDDTLRSGAISLVRVPGTHERQTRLLGIAPKAWLEGFDVLREPSATWHRADILAGLPRITLEASDKEVPQSLNLDRLQAVSFEKGCYVGQEIVTRLSHLGRIKKRCFIGHTKGDIEVGARIVRDPPSLSNPPSGSESAAHDAKGFKVGTVISAASKPDGGSIALAALDIEAALASDLRVERIDGPEIRFRSPAWLDPTDPS
ncbi:CAF17-like 4Fe-4S cluster assembly/insertion protein YgfZ [Thioalkalivibrio sp. HK1]|uniref:CAF17-like 4Fe-4S cluster assembly/insertion protein YgfZ n=1 Tax=Thioalkalivibrio sp. HK1 TaxID=1469245 RepID=UPI00047027FB|nr:folate-binding protein YgfZ [Thioalkalivibrio sp. HK1]